MSRLDNFKGRHNTSGFDQNPQNIGGGRPKKIYNVLKNLGYSADDMKTAFFELAFYTETELKAMYDNETKPIITRIIANQFLQALKESDWGKIKEILEHVIGKPNQSTDITTGGEKVYQETTVTFINARMKK